MFERILIPYDGSVGAERALVKAIQLARLCDAQLTVLTLIPVAGALMARGIGFPG